MLLSRLHTNVWLVEDSSESYGDHCLAGFPLDNAVAYEKLKNPFVINVLDLQYCIQDRWAPSPLSGPHLYSKPSHRPSHLYCRPLIFTAGLSSLLQALIFTAGPLSGPLIFTADPLTGSSLLHSQTTFVFPSRPCGKALNNYLVIFWCTRTFSILPRLVSGFRKLQCFSG